MQWPTMKTRTTTRRRMGFSTMRRTDKTPSTVPWGSASALVLTGWGSKSLQRSDKSSERWRRFSPSWADGMDGHILDTLVFKSEPPPDTDTALLLSYWLQYVCSSSARCRHAAATTGQGGSQWIQWEPAEGLYAKVCRWAAETASGSTKWVQVQLRRVAKVPWLAFPRLDSFLKGEHQNDSQVRVYMCRCV